MKAILTKYHGPTNHLPIRITAYDSSGNRVTVSRDNMPDDFAIHSAEDERPYRWAAVKLCEKMKWNGAEFLIAGGIKGGYTFVFMFNLCSCST